VYFDHAQYVAAMRRVVCAASLCSPRCGVGDGGGVNVTHRVHATPAPPPLTTAML